MKEKIESVLAEIIEPDSGGNLTAAKIASVNCAADKIEIALRFPYPAATICAALEKEIAARLREANLPAANIQSKIEIFPRIVQGGTRRLPAVKNIIAVSSAKGGVGKSAVAVNLALGLMREGARVGMLDADIYGPSLPLMLGLRERPQSGKDGGITPLAAHGMQVMSLGFLVDEDQPAIWRGPMATRALVQLLEETRWENLDYLVLDMPPGTGDIQLTAAQKIPITGAVIITTPQQIAVADAQKGLAMFRKANIPVLGAVENMSGYACPCCGRETHIFGQGGAKAMCEKYGVPLLGELPLHPAIREDADGGKPTVIKTPDGELAARFRQIARRAAAQIAQKPRDFSNIIPQIVPEK
ncbi:MAG: iron-sulfur cluster carrier protein ApbC [Gammaproteobacteria bacterium]